MDSVDNVDSVDADIFCGDKSRAVRGSRHRLRSAGRDERLLVRRRLRRQAPRNARRKNTFNFQRILWRPLQNLSWHGRPAHETRARCPCHTRRREVLQEPQMQLISKPCSIMANNRKEHNCGTRTARAAFRAVCGLRSEDLGVTAPRIGRGHGDCAPCPSHTTGRAVFRIRRLDTAEVADAPPRSPTAW